MIAIASAERMQALGRALGRTAQPGDRFLLEGPFGAGKTTFVQGLANGLDATVPVSSPSFVLENQYPGRLTLYHIDLYRLTTVEAAFWEEIAEDIYGDGVAAVEWAERLPDWLREDATRIVFHVAEDGVRQVTIAPAIGREELLETADLAGVS
ncbi:MAG: tRNA (adenosine(37)-N6)-threonylcarbamoyltransferase complex ATPase subunit type 1 TsaE [Chloroflexota bacterium]